MGHTRLGSIPKSKPWKHLVALYASAEVGTTPADYAAAVGRLAAQTMAAAAGALQVARKDPGLTHVYFLLTQLSLAARQPDLERALYKLGIRIPKDASSFELTSEVHRILDDHFLTHGSRSDLAEMAQLALGESLAAYFRSMPRDMFATGPEQLRRDLHGLGTQKNFGDISRQFFANLTHRLLAFYLSKIVRPGQGQHFVHEHADLTRFNDELRRHSFQRAILIRDFAGQWFSKTEFEKGIDSQQTRRFIAQALKKLEAEFSRSREGE